MGQFLEVQVKNIFTYPDELEAFDSDGTGNCGKTVTSDLDLFLSGLDSESCLFCLLMLLEGLSIETMQKERSR